MVLSSSFAMANNDLEEIDLDDMGDLPRDVDYDMEYLVRNR